MRQSEKIGEFTKAFVAAQKQFKSAEKDGENPDFHSNYATIESVIDSVVPALNNQGIAVLQRPSADDQYQGACLETMLIHTSGEWMSSLIRIPSGKNDAHGFGSAYTYARRYSLAAMCGIKQFDDDGNGASEKEKAEYEKRKKTDRMKSLPKDILQGFAYLKSTEGKGMLDEKYRESVLKVMDANNDDTELLRGYLRDKGWTGLSPIQGEEGMTH